MTRLDEKWRRTRLDEKWRAQIRKEVNARVIQTVQRRRAGFYWLRQRLSVGKGGNCRFEELLGSFIDSYHSVFIQSRSDSECTFVFSKLSIENCGNSLLGEIAAFPVGSTSASECAIDWGLPLGVCNKKW